MSSTHGPVFFWRECERPYGFLSQWYPSAFTVSSSSPNGQPITISTTEQYMMYHKAMLFGDTQTAEKIVLATAPAAQKSLGRQVKCLREDVWDLNKEKIVEEGNWNKFRDAEDNTGLRRMLLGTGDRELVEASPGDKVWGIGYKAHDAEANRDKWGGNLLGKALMRVRSRLQELDGPKCNF